MKYEVGQKVETPLGVGIIFEEEKFDMDLGEWYIEVMIGERFGFNRVIPFETVDLKPYKSAHDKLIDMGFEMVLDDEEFTIFEHQELDYTIRVDKIWKGIGIHHYNDDPNYRYIYLEISRILTQYLEELEK